MGIEGIKENFYNIPFIIGGKLLTSVSKKITPAVNGYSPFPHVITFYLTESCNLDCDMCFLKNIDVESKFIPVHIVEKIIREVEYIRPRFGMSGGEPFLHPDIEELIILIKEKGLSLSIVTNGTLLSRYAELIVKSGVERIKISIDGTPEVHDKIRGLPGTFEILNKGIRKINRWKMKKRSNKPRFFLYSLLNPSLDPEFIIKFAEENYFDTINFLHILSVRKEDLEEFENNLGMDAHYWKGAVFDNNAFRIKKGLIKRIKSIETEVNITFTPDISPEKLGSYYIKDKEYLKSFTGNCGAPWVSVYIKPPDRVELCPDTLIGNIRNKRFLDVWNSIDARNYRKRIYSGNMLPVCNGCCNFYQ